MNTLLILDHDASQYKEIIAAHKLPDLHIHSAENIAQALPLIASVNILLASPESANTLLSKAEKLCWLQSTFSGVDRLCGAGVPKKYTLTGIKDVFGPLMSEYVFLYILAIERQLIRTFNQQSEKLWAPIPYRGLQDITIGIAGLGSIGRHIASTATHFGMKVLGLKRTSGSVPHVDQVYTLPGKSDFLSQLDYLVITLPATPQTHHFIQLPDLKLMKTSSYLISVGRGSNVKEDDLITALDQKYIKGAVLDVFEQEPLAPDSRLWNIPGVFVTPHNSAFSFPAQIAAIFCDNYMRYISGKKLKYIVDFKKGY